MTDMTTDTTRDTERTDAPREERQGISTADMAAAGQRPAEAPAEQEAPTDGANREREQVGIQARDEEEAPAPLMSEDAAGGYRNQWQDVQAEFVDDPRNAVERADALVAEVMQQLAQEFAREREGLEKQWSGGGQASTEDLRLALRRYRSFFGRLLSV